MSISHQAKQFAPFAALNGYESAVRKKERIFYARPELSDEQKTELDWKIRMVTYGMNLSVTYYRRCQKFQQDIGIFHTVEGIVRFIDTGTRQLRVEDVGISFDNIMKLNNSYFDMPIK